MRVNIPITQKAVDVGDDAFIMTKTDLTGTITSVNEDFTQVSGYSADELIGQNHNILRHLDMPIELYEDLWQTLKAGRQWDGIMKNRCKNGNHFWVEAQITPQRKNGEIVGYVAYRKKVSPEKITEFEGVFRKFRANKAGKMYFREGELIRRPGLLKRLYDLRVEAQLAAGWVMFAMVAKMISGG